MKLSDIFNLKSKEGKYLIYQIEQYNKLVITLYVSLFLNRVGNLESLLDDDFFDAKKSVDSEIDKINLLIDSLDLNNLDGETMNILTEKINELSMYLEYLNKTKLKSEEYDGSFSAGDS